MERRKTGRGWLVLLIAVAAALPYLGTLRADFVWDDDLLVLDHAYYRDPALFWSTFTRNLIFSPNYFRPLGLLTFFADFQLYGFRPWGYHLTNVLIHAATSAVAYLLLRRLLRAGPGWLPPALALLFAWHPVQVEAVSFVAGRFDLLCTLFYLLALRLGVAAWEARGAGRWPLAAGTGLAFLLALASKEMAATLPLTLGVVLAGMALRIDRWRMCSVRALSLLLCGALGGLAYLGLRAGGMGYLYRIRPEAGLPAGDARQHALLVARSLARYLRLLAFPWGALSPIHYADIPLSTAAPGNWLALALTLALLGALVGAAYRALRRARSAPPTPPVALWLAFAVTLLPVVNLLPLEIGGGAFVCERFLYLPTFFFLAALGAGWVAVAARWPGARRALAVALPPVAVACLVGVLVTVPHWRDDVALWTWAAARAPRSDVPWTNLAVQAGNAGQAEQALDYANRALARNPQSASAHDVAGLALFLLGDHQEAEVAFRTALALEPDDAHLWSNLAGAVREQGRVEEAAQLLTEEALARDPTLWSAHLGLGLCYRYAGQPDRAIAPLRAAARYQPQHPDPWRHLVAALAAAGQGEEALATLARAPFAAPAAWFDLGNALLAADQPAEALLAYGRALEGVAPPDAASVHLQRGMAYVALGDLAEAEAALRAGLALAPQDGRLHNNLGMVLRDLGDRAGARAAFERARHLLPDSDMVAANLAQLQDGE
jgi:tetratricopeptide (TPR) repeat protein